MAYLILFLFFTAGPFPALSEVNINIDVTIPPPLQFNVQPDLVVVPSGPAYVYMLPEMTGVYFYRGSWYRYYDGSWFKSRVFSGDWAPVSSATVPPVIVDVPPEYPFYIPRDYYRIHCHDVFVRWREWENIRHWNHYDWYKHELSEDVRLERLRDIDKERAMRKNENEKERLLRSRDEQKRAEDYYNAEHLAPGDKRSEPMKPGQSQLQQPAQRERQRPGQLQKKVPGQNQPQKPEMTLPRRMGQPNPQSLKQERTQPRKARPQTVMPGERESLGPGQPQPLAGPQKHEEQKDQGQR
jgi:hypothetical protein